MRDESRVLSNPDAVVLEALERDLPLDPLAAALATDLHDGETWRRIGEPANGVSVYVVGVPVRGFVICSDKGGERIARRIDANGVQMAAIVGRRVGVVEELGQARVANAAVEVELITAAVDKVLGGVDGK